MLRTTRFALRLHRLPFVLSLSKHKEKPFDRLRANGVVRNISEYSASVLVRLDSFPIFRSLT